MKCNEQNTIAEKRYRDKKRWKGVRLNTKKHKNKTLKLKKFIKDTLKSMFTNYKKPKRNHKRKKNTN